MASKVVPRNGTVSSGQAAQKFKITSNVIVEETKKRNKNTFPQHKQLEELTRQITTSTTDNRMMMELLPDLKLVRRILVPSILSPKDLSTYALTLKIDDNALTEETPADVLQAIERHFKTIYDLESKLSVILDEALFDTGSYCLLVVPESTLSNLVQSRITGMESYQSIIDNNRNYFEPVGFISGEPVKGGYTVTDNINHLLAGPTRRRALSASVYSRLGIQVGNEALRDVPTMSFPAGQGENGKRVNNPLVMRIPSDAIIPVYTPSDPSDHLGYYILLDSNGSPTSSIKHISGLDKLKTQITDAATGNSLGGLIKSTGFTIGTAAASKDPDLLINQYIDIVQNELESQLKKGSYGAEVSVARPEGVYQLMLSRLLANQLTRVLYVPAELLTYFAFDFTDAGVGKSLLEDTKIFGSLRAILLFAEVMAGVKNSVGRTSLDITLDEDDPDVSSTVEAIIHNFTRMQTEALPVGALHAGDIISSLRRASVEVNIEGGDAFPGTKSTIGENNREYHAPDSDLRDTLRRMQYSGIGIPPEIVDSAMEGELATVVVSRNQLYAKQVMEYGAKFEKLVSNFIRTYIRCSGELINLISNSGMTVSVDDYIAAISFKLPTPDLARITSQSEAFDEYSEAIDKAVESYITEDMLAEFVDGDLDMAALSSLRVSYSNMLKREWMAQQNILPEIAGKLASGDAAKRIKDYNAEIMATLADIILPMVKDESKVTDKLNKAIADIEAKRAEEEEAARLAEEAANTENGDTGGTDDGGDGNADVNPDEEDAGGSGGDDGGAVEGDKGDTDEGATPEENTF